MRAVVLLLLCALSACGAEEDEGDVDPSRLQAAAVSDTLDVAFTLSAEGAGSQLIDDFVIDGAGGTFTLAGVEHAVVVYERIVWPNYDYVLYQALAVRSDAWVAFWLYCTDDTQRAAWVWYEGTSGPVMTAEQVSGTCHGTTTPSRMSVALPATDMPLPALVPNFTVSGAQLRVSGAQAGELVLAGASYTFFAFGQVDCTTCATPGWYELHALFRREGHGEVGFTIFYLHEGSRPLQNAYSLRLPALDDPLGDNELAGSWSRTP